MFHKSKVKSVTKISEQNKKKSTAQKSNNLYVSPSLIGKFHRFTERKQKSCFSKSSLKTGEVSTKQESPIKSNVAKERLISNLPQDVAVHFGNFYGAQGNANKPQAGRVKDFTEFTTPRYKATPRLEFTRQMVQKLERTAGTEEYARQVSALLEETVEPAHFKLHSLPAENSIPDGRHNPTGFPLWYKEPYKMPFSSDEVYKLLKEKFDSGEKRAKDVFDEGSTEKNSLEEWSEEEQGEDENLQDTENLLAKEKSSTHFLSNGSSSVTEAKDTDSKESNETYATKKPSKVRFSNSPEL